MSTVQITQESQSVREKKRQPGSVLSGDSRPAGVPLNLRHAALISSSPGQVFTVTAILVQAETRSSPTQAECNNVGQ